MFDITNPNFIALMILVFVNEIFKFFLAEKHGVLFVISVIIYIFINFLNYNYLNLSRLKIAITSLIIALSMPWFKIFKDYRDKGKDFKLNWEIFPNYGILSILVMVTYGSI
jgi:hypothetical protein